MTEREHMECVKFTVERTKRKNPGYRRNRLKLYEDGNGIIERGSRLRCGWCVSRNAIL